MKHPKINFLFTLVIFSLLSLMAVGADIGLPPDMLTGIGSTTASLGVIGFLSGPILEEFEPDGKGGSGGAIADLKDKVMGGINGIRDEVRNNKEELSKNFTTLDTESKALAEKLDKLQKDTETDATQLNKTIVDIRTKLNNEYRANHGSALDRLKSDKGLNDYANFVIRGGAKSLYSGAEGAMGILQKGLADSGILDKAAGDTNLASSIDDTLVNTVYQLVAEYGIWNQFDVIPVSNSTVKLPVDTSDPVMNVVGAGIEPAESEYAGTQLSADIVKIMAWIGVPSEQLEDSNIDVASHLLRKFARATAKKLDFFCIAADGGNDAIDGNLTGIQEGGTAAVAASGNVSVATLDPEDFTAAMLACDEAVIGQGRWWLHPFQLARILASVKDGNGRPIYISAMDAPDFGAFGSINGEPVTLTHVANSTDGVSKAIATYGSPNGLAVALRRDFDFANSADAKFLNDEVVFRAKARVATKIKQATAFGVLTTAAS